MPNLRRRIIGAVSQFKLPLLPAGIAMACIITALTRGTYQAVAGHVPPLAALAIASAPMTAFVVAVILWSSTPPADERPEPEPEPKRARPRNTRRVPPVEKDVPRNQRPLTRGVTAMRSNLNGTYLDDNGTPRAGKPTTGDGVRVRQPIPGREVRYLDGLDELAATLPNYTRWPQVDRKAIV